MIGEGIIQFHSHGAASLLFKVFVMFKIKLQFHLLALHEERFNFSSECDLMKVFKDAQVKFQIESVSNIYMLQNSEVTVSGLQLFSVSRSKVLKQSEITIVSSSDVQFYLKGRFGLGCTGAQ